MELKPLVLNPPLNIIRIQKEEELEILFEFFKRENVLGWDIETNPVKDFFWRRCRTMQFGTTKEQFVVDLLGLCDNDSELLNDCQGEYGKNLHKAPKLKRFIDRLQSTFCGKDILKVGVNLGFEYGTTLWSFGLRAFNFFSTDMVERVLQAGLHSLKHYEYYSMESMMNRYFGVSIEKELQTSFNLSDYLSDAQWEYAGLDTRLPLALRLVQLKALLKYNLLKTADIENNAIGAFQDMYLHGENIDTAKWNAYVFNVEKKHKEIIKELDTYFIPLVGDKNVAITEEEINAATVKWKSLTATSEEEYTVKLQIKQAKNDKNAELVTELQNKLVLLGEQRKLQKDILKEECAELKRRRKKLNDLINECEGQALINYSSNKQLLLVLKSIKGLGKIKDTNDNTLNKYKHIDVIKVIQKYREYSKSISTYGYTWSTKWVTKPCAVEGWLHPGDGRLHSQFNQLDAETGRSTSDKPNGQNLPQDKAVRSCFIVDPPNPNILVSMCCDDEIQDGTCKKCGNPCIGKPEEYVMVTADMSGAELRIIAELANAKTWIEAFERDEDVHSVGTEIMYPDLWPKLTVHSKINPDKWTLEDCKTEKIPLFDDNSNPVLNDEGKQKSVPSCAYFAYKPNGQLAKEKCECPGHKKLRDGNKSTNFLLAYGGTHFTLAERIGVTTAEALKLMMLHSQKFPDIWAYLDKSGKNAKLLKESRDMFGRRRLFPDPTWDRAKEKAKEDREEQLRYSDITIETNIKNFIASTGRKPNKEEKYFLSHREPSSNEIANAYAGMHGSIERQGKNHAIQGSNASIIKISLGSGYSPKGMPYLWHTLPLLKAKLLKMVHDELVVMCPKRNGMRVAKLIGRAFEVAAAEKMTKVKMKFDFKIAGYWSK